LEITSQEDTGAADIIGVIDADQSLTANLLRVANSPVFGVPNRIQSAKQAVVLLGFNEVRSIALSATVFSMFEAAEGETVFNREAFWRHSYLVAHLTRELFTKFPDADNKALYFTAGLLHDIGIVVMDQFFRPEFKDIVETIQQENEMPLRAEGRFMGVNHAAIGAVLLRRWQLPKLLVKVVETHHNPWDAPAAAAPLVRALYYGNLLAQLIGYPAYAQSEAPTVEGFLDSADAQQLAEAGMPLDKQWLADTVTRYKEDEILLDLIMGAATPM